MAPWLVPMFARTLPIFQAATRPVTSPLWTGGPTTAAIGAIESFDLRAILEHREPMRRISRLLGWLYSRSRVHAEPGPHLNAQGLHAADHIKTCWRGRSVNALAAVTFGTARPRRPSFASPFSTGAGTIILESAAASTGNDMLRASRFRLPVSHVTVSLLPYLTQAAEDQLLAAVDRSTPAGSCMLVDAWGGSSDAGHGFPAAAVDAPLRDYFRALAHWRSEALLGNQIL
ncbi:hypothetical protein DFJ73DRAFT_782433 [Zopfochytrium polystomum]|nr:hypothetical protein DFJ73DRAFT_782433 [Zopfochytrium polystomum]